MKKDKELLEIWENKELSYKNLDEYECLALNEKVRIFDLITEGDNEKK